MTKKRTYILQNEKAKSTFLALLYEMKVNLEFVKGEWLEKAIRDHRMFTLCRYRWSL